MLSFGIIPNDESGVTQEVVVVRYTFPLSERRVHGTLCSPALHDPKKSVCPVTLFRLILVSILKFPSIHAFLILCGLSILKAPELRSMHLTPNLSTTCGFLIFVRVWFPVRSFISLFTIPR
nr:MAG TPA: hypothetical protein [Bacteriophage sp.]